MSDQNTQDNNTDELAQKVAAAQAAAEEENQEQSELENLRKELEDMSELAKRTMADFQNYKRRQEEERAQMSTSANIGLIKSLLSVLDNLLRSQQDWTEGIEMCVNQFKKTLEDQGVVEIEAEGQPFNPDFHEALLQGEGPQDQVVEVLEKGYKIGDRVIRHAKVKVGNGQ